MTNKSDQPATKGDLTILATKTELKKTEKVLREEILRVEERLENKIDKNHDTIVAKLDNLLTSVSNFAGRVATLEDENEIGTDRIHELRETTKDHEKRIAKLESPN